MRLFSPAGGVSAMKIRRNTLNCGDFERTKNNIFGAKSPHASARVRQCMHRRLTRLTSRMPSMIARPLDKDLSSFRRLVARITQPASELYDAHFGAQFILRAANPAHALAVSVYGRPAESATKAATSIFAKVSRGGELIAIRFSGRPRANMDGKCRLRIDFVLRKNHLPNSEQNSERASLAVLSARYDKNAREGFEQIDSFLNWAAREAICIAKGANGLWAWHSSRSASPDDIVVQDWRLCSKLSHEFNPEPAQVSALSSIPPALANFLEQEQTKRDARQRRRLGVAALSVIEHEKARLEKLVLAENIANAVAMGERLRLQAEVKKASRKPIVKAPWSESADDAEHDSPRAAAARKPQRL